MKRWCREATNQMMIRIRILSAKCLCSKERRAIVGEVQVGVGKGGIVNVEDYCRWVKVGKMNVERMENVEEGEVKRVKVNVEGECRK